MALKWNQVYIFDDQNKELNGPRARAYIKSRQPGLLHQREFKEAVVLTEGGKSLVDNEQVKQKLRDAFPNRIRFTGEAALRPPPLPIRKHKDNVVVLPAPDYRKVQFIGFHIQPTIGQKDIVGSDSEHTGHYRGPRGKGKAKDLESRCSILRDAIAAAAKSSKLDKDDRVLKVFMAPEFYFRGYDGGYPIEKVSSIMDEMRKETVKADYKDWVFIHGTAIGYLKQEAGARKHTLNISEVQTLGTGLTALKVTHLDVPPDAEQAIICQQIVQPFDPLFQWSVTQGSTGAAAGIRVVTCLNQPSDEYILALDAVAAFQPGPVELSEPEATEVFNLAMIQRGGPQPKGRAPGLRDAIVYKEYVSAIDFIGPHYAKHAIFHKKTGTNRVVKIHHEVTRVLPTEGSVDVLSAKVNVPGTDLAYRDSKGVDKTQRISEISNTGLGGGSVFTMDGVTFGVEVCLDHGRGKLSNFYTQGQAQSGDPYVQVHLIPSWGMSIEADHIGCVLMGLIFNVDGSRCDSVARVNDYKYSCENHPSLAKDAPEDCPIPHSYFCNGDPHGQEIATIARACPTCNDWMQPLFMCEGHWQPHPLRYGNSGDACSLCGRPMEEFFYCDGGTPSTHPRKWAWGVGQCGICLNNFISIGRCDGQWVPHPPAVASSAVACSVCGTLLRRVYGCEGVVPHPLEIFFSPRACSQCGTLSTPAFYCEGKPTHAEEEDDKPGSCPTCGRQLNPEQPALEPLGSGIPIIDGPTNVTLTSGLDWKVYYADQGQIVVYGPKDIPARQTVP